MTRRAAKASRASANDGSTTYQPRRALTVVHPQAIELLAETTNRGKGRSDPRSVSVEASPRVQERQVLRWVEELLMFVLAVKLDEMIGQVLQRGGGRQGAIDERPAAAL